MRYAIDRGDFGPVDPDERIEQILERARSLSPPRFEIDRADGISIEVRRAPMPDGGFVTTYTDITYQKQSARLEAANEAKSRFPRKHEPRPAETHRRGDRGLPVADLQTRQFSR